MTQLKVVLNKLYTEYIKRTPKKLKIIDAYLLYVFLTGIIQFVYCCLVGTFPFNSFLSGFISCVSCFILGGLYSKKNSFKQVLGCRIYKNTNPIGNKFLQKLSDSVCLRLQVNPQNKNDFFGISAERGFADFIFAHIILHLVVMNFIG